ncbi:MAG: alpha/beta hydrolase, partial [Patulibacter sp.]|nr:alpha/beta hydrolase [Patulibacter sp.]
MSDVLIVIVGALSLVLALNARAPRRSLQLIIPSWFAAYLVVELAIHLSVIGGALIALLALAGGGLGTTGVVGLVLWALATAIVIPFGLSTMRTRLDVQGRPDDFEAGNLDAGGPTLPWWLFVVPVLMWWRPGVTTTRGIVFAEYGKKKVKLDLARPKGFEDGPLLPAVINVHGGVWMFGSRLEQGQPLMNHLAANGWATFNIDYRLSPRATMPDHIVDVKRAIAYVREHAAELHVDPDFIAITGGSAGGHLATLAALTPDDPSFQPGFEDADTSVDVAVPFYGAYDLVDDAGKAEPALRYLVEKYV